MEWSSTKLSGANRTLEAIFFKWKFIEIKSTLWRWWGVS
jgi:hypothetical protein